MKCLIVDDEHLARERLRRLLNDLEEVEVCGEAANGREALLQIEALYREAVAAGMAMAAELSARHGWLSESDVERIRALLIRMNSALACSAPSSSTCRATSIRARAAARLLSASRIRTGYNSLSWAI